MHELDQKLIDFLELLNTYPSPHNGQPLRLKLLSEDTFEAWFQRERGLQATDISFIFSFVSMGVFMEFAVAVAAAQGHALTYQLKLPTEDELKGSGPVTFGNISIKWAVHQPDAKLLEALKFRQTSRKKYHEGLSPELSETIIRNTGDNGMVLTKLTRQQANQTIWLNQRAVFDDMFDPAVATELDHWLRYSKEEKESKRDGLSYDCMELNGPMMKHIVHHPGLLRAPILSGIIKQYYLRTMADNSDVFYMMAPFETGEQSFAVGKAIAKVWLSLSLQGYYLHPFGTIMSNEAAHTDFLKLAGVSDESRANYLVFIFRAGKSDTPVRSLRLPYDKHLIMR